MTYFQMARQCGITMMDSRLIEVEGTRHFLTRRFDRKDGEKRFMQTLAAVDPDAHSYEDMFRTCRELEIPKPEIDELFKRAVFNVFTNNTDDHEKCHLKASGIWPRPMTSPSSSPRMASSPK